MTTNALHKLTQIVQRANQANSAREQVQVIVDSISHELSIDVCSLYRQLEDRTMVLLASHGLAANHPVVIPHAAGIVGQVVKLKHSINIINPEHHPDYYYVPTSREELFHSFCGVPIIYHGEVIGVLVVQSQKAEQLPSEQEAILTTLAAHLSLLINALPNRDIKNRPVNEVKKGISGSSGIAIGIVKTVVNERLNQVVESNCDDIGDEFKKWHTLKSTVSQDLINEQLILEKSLGKSLASVLDAYILFLQDSSFDARVKQEINHGKSITWAIKQAVQVYSEKFLAIDDPYLKSKHEDIEQLGEKLYQTLLGNSSDKMNAIPHNSIILVGHTVGVSDIAGLPTEKLSGMVCFEGAALSHIAVFANALGIPAVMGTGVFKVNDGENIVIDGDKAQVFLNPAKALIDEYQDTLKNRTKFDSKLLATKHLPAITKDGTQVNLMTNSGLQADLLPGIENGADGIGLYRTEIPFMLRQSLPSEEQQVRVYQEVIQAYKGKPVYIRSLDIGADKPLHYLPIIREENPALGLRGIRFTLENIQILITQFRAIIKASGDSENVHVTLPMISSGFELDKCIRLFDDAYTQLLDEGLVVRKPKLGIMVEIPSAITLLPYWADKLDFVSIGSNDLSQYLLAIDRNNPLVAHYYDPLHPAVIHEIKRIVSTCRQANLPASLCGEMASDPVAVFILLGLGIRTFSISAAKIPLIKWLIRSITLTEANRILPELLQLDDASAIRMISIQKLRKMGVKID